MKNGFRKKMSKMSLIILISSFVLLKTTKFVNANCDIYALPRPPVNPGGAYRWDCRKKNTKCTLICIDTVDHDWAYKGIVPAWLTCEARDTNHGFIDYYWTWKVNRTLYEPRLTCKTEIAYRTNHETTFQDVGLRVSDTVIKEGYVESNDESEEMSINIEALASIGGRPMPGSTNINPFDDYRDQQSYLDDAEKATFRIGGVEIDFSPRKNPNNVNGPKKAKNKGKRKQKKNKATTEAPSLDTVSLNPVLDSPPVILTNDPDRNIDYGSVTTADISWSQFETSDDLDMDYCTDV